MSGRPPGPVPEPESESDTTSGGIAPEAAGPLTLSTMSLFCEGNRHARVRAYLEFLGVHELVLHCHGGLGASPLRATLPPVHPRSVQVFGPRATFTVGSITCTPGRGRFEDPAFWFDLIRVLTAPSEHPWVRRLRRRPSVFEIVWRSAFPTVRVTGRYFRRAPLGTLVHHGSALTLDVPDPPDDGSDSVLIPLHYAERVLGCPLPGACHNRMLAAGISGDPSATGYFRRVSPPKDAVLGSGGR